MTQKLSAFNIIEVGISAPVNYQRLPCHHADVFEVKINLTQKTRLEVGGHITNALANQMYVSLLVSRESAVIITLLIASINIMEELSDDM